MAILIPPKPVGSASPSVVRMFQALRRLPDSFTVWFAMDSGLPHFFVLWRERHGFLIQVAGTTQELAETTLQRSFLDGSFVSPDELGADERRVLEHFVGSARSSEGIEVSPELPVRRLVVFPNVEQATIDEIELHRSKDQDTAYLGMKQMAESDFSRRLEALASAPLGAPELFVLRKRFTPEAVIHDACRPLPLAHRHTDLPEFPGFLDFDQESLVKLDMELTPDAERVAGEQNARLVTGLAGSGKSLVLLHRAMQIARLHPGSRLLVLTHNRPINGELRRRFGEMMPEFHGIVWKTFFSWATGLIQGPPNRIVSPAETERMIAQLKRGDAALERFTPAFLTEEINYLRDLGIATEEEYLALERSGRSTGLSVERRSLIWKLLLDYRAMLAGRGDSDWYDIALAFRDFAVARPERLTPKHDFIFIDEAQFFAKLWFAPVLAALKPGGQLFLSADPTQGFLKRRQSWLAAGIDVRGRASRLGKAYRSTRRILSFATSLYRLHQPDGEGAEVDLADRGSLEAMDEIGTWPEIVRVATPRQEIDRAVEQVMKIKSQRPELAGRVVLLHTDARAISDLGRALETKLGAGSVRDAKDLGSTSYRHFCTISTLNAATGLEAAIVLVLGLDRLIELESDPRLEPDALAEMRADHAKMLYVASTRAARRLILFARSDGFEGLCRLALERAATLFGKRPDQIE